MNVLLDLTVDGDCHYHLIENGVIGVYTYATRSEAENIADWNKALVSWCEIETSVTACIDPRCPST